MNMGTTKPKEFGIAPPLIGAVFVPTVSGDGSKKSRSQTINDITELARDDLHGMYRRYAIG
ncbi:MAG: hypothetical protein U9N07_03350 [Euryarchaeota archaeon]|nr:hypothetical protein [Euryarchaeota archaeon]